MTFCGPRTVWLLWLLAAWLGVKFRLESSCRASRSRWLVPGSRYILSHLRRVCTIPSTLRGNVHRTSSRCRKYLELSLNRKVKKNSLTKSCIRWGQSCHVFIFFQHVGSHFQIQKVNFLANLNLLFLFRFFNVAVLSKRRTILVHNNV